MTIRPTTRQFSLRPESELLVWCARTVVTDELKARIRQRVQESLDWAVILDMARYHGVGPLLYRNLSTLCPDLVPADTDSIAPEDASRRLTEPICSLKNLLACAKRLPREACRSCRSKALRWRCRPMAI